MSLTNDETERARDFWAKTNNSKAAADGVGESYAKSMQAVVDAPVPDDSVDHPPHYTRHPSGVECIQITESMNFCLGNAIKYIWRADLKGGVEDLKKAKWYLQREIDRLEGLI